MRYYLVDHGREMIEAANAVTDHLSKQGCHYVVYLTDADGLMCVEEISENEFLDHFKRNNASK